MRFSQLVPWKHKTIGRVLLGPSWENRVMYGGLCQHTRVVLYLLYTQLKYTLITVLKLKDELCDMMYVIWTAISNGHIK